MSGPARLAVFASGRGSNLQALLDHFNRRSSSVARVELVVASSGGMEAIERARGSAVRTRLIDTTLPAGEQSASILPELEALGIDLIVLAGYVRLVPATIVHRFHGRMLNIHPALLPSFGGPGMYGVRVHQAVLSSGARVSGATVHIVDERYDEGRIVAQWPVPVFPNDTAERLAARVLRVEHLLLPAAVEMVLGAWSYSTPNPDLSFELTDRSAPSPSSVRRFLFPPTDG